MSGFVFCAREKEKKLMRGPGAVQKTWLSQGGGQLNGSRGLGAPGDDPTPSSSRENWSSTWPPGGAGKNSAQRARHLHPDFGRLMSKNFRPDDQGGQAQGRLEEKKSDCVGWGARRPRERGYIVHPGPKNKRLQAIFGRCRQKVGGSEGVATFLQGECSDIVRLDLGFEKKMPKWWEDWPI